MGEPHSCSHTTPLVDRFAICDDSGYLTNTPESTDSVRYLSRYSLPSGKRLLQQEKSEFLLADNGTHYTPVAAGPKTLRHVSFDCNQPFPKSAEESRAINPFSESNWDGLDDNFLEQHMCVDKGVDDAEDFAQEGEGEVFNPDSQDASLYEGEQHGESRQAKKHREYYKQTGMEIDDNVLQLHPNSENEDWDELDNYRPHDQHVEEKASRRKSVSVETPHGQQLLLEKLENLKTNPQEPDCTKGPTLTSWRHNLKKKGHRFALDFSGKNTMDFLSYLGIHSNHQPVISQILDYLPPADLQSCTYVSKAWRTVCSQDRKSMERLHRYKRQLASLKENHVKHSFSNGQHRFGPLAAIGNFHSALKSPPTSPVKSPTKTRYQECMDLEKMGAVVVLCPRCQGPAKVDKPVLEAECYKSGCKYVFCTTCRLQSHRPKSCLYVTGRKAPKRGTIGSKESRRNLRRLLKN